MQVAVPRPLRRTFDYAVPARMRMPAIGARVRVPFGSTNVVGLVTGHPETSVQALKPIDELLDEDPLLPPDLTDLATWLARYYHHPIGDVLAALLPVRARRGAPAALVDEFVWQATGAGHPDALSRAPRQRQVHEQLQALGSIYES